MIISGVLSPSLGPPQQTYTAPDPTKGFGSIVVYNSSQSAINVFLNNVGIITNVPDYTVPALTVITYPIPGINYLTVAFAIFPATGGNATITITDTVLTAASSLLPGGLGGSGVLPPANPALAGGLESASVRFFNIPSNEGAGSSVQVLPVPVISPFLLSTYVYSLSVCWVSSNQAGIGILENYMAFGIIPTIGTTVFQLQIISDEVDAELNTELLGKLQGFTLSGGPLPIFVCPPPSIGDSPLYVNFTDTNGGAGSSQHFGTINLTYAQY